MYRNNMTTATIDLTFSSSDLSKFVIKTIAIESKAVQGKIWQNKSVFSSVDIGSLQF